MTPRELERAMSVLPGSRDRAPGRMDLLALMKRYPDERRGTHG